jgi:hypothetical protein
MKFKYFLPIWIGGVSLAISGEYYKEWWHWIFVIVGWILILKGAEWYAGSKD